MNVKDAVKFPIFDAFVHNRCFARRLRELRLRRSPRLSQERLARNLGVKRATLANYETGRVAVPLWFACAAASYFGVDIQELISEERTDDNADIPSGHTQKNRR